MTLQDVCLFVFFCVFFGAFILPIWAVIVAATGNFEKEDQDER